MKSVVLALGLFLSSLAIAHEGHNKTPGVIAAPNGGMIKGTTEAYLELLVTGEEIKIYVFDHDFKPIPMDKHRLTAKYTLPRKSVAEPVSLTVVKDHYVGKISSQGAHRYNLDFSIAVSGKPEQVKFTVEPQ